MGCGDGALKGFGLRVKPSGMASYFVQYRNKEGRTRRLVLGRVSELTPDEARGWLPTKLKGVRTGADPSADRRRSLGNDSCGIVRPVPCGRQRPYQSVNSGDGSQPHRLPRKASNRPPRGRWTYLPRNRAFAGRRGCWKNSKAAREPRPRWANHWRSCRCRRELLECSARSSNLPDGKA